jgi:hypothetical protein
MPRTRDLLIVSRERIGLVDQFRQSAPDLEVRVDSRLGERRSASPSEPSAECRRRRDRRALDVGSHLRTVGWALVPALGLGGPTCAVCRQAIETREGYYARDQHSYHVECYPHRSPPPPARRLSR